ncbi:hypothetical protein O9929_22940 [Vibrio lentus]|nr:hypothetical protein [Vibrio lentus]
MYHSTSSTSPSTSEAFSSTCDSLKVSTEPFINGVRRWASNWRIVHFKYGDTRSCRIGCPSSSATTTSRAISPLKFSFGEKVASRYC